MTASGPRYFASCMICLLAANAYAEEGRFYYEVKTGSVIEGSTSIDPVDPEICGADLGWIETVTAQTEAEVTKFLLPPGRYVRLRKGADVQTIDLGEAGPTLDLSGTISVTFKRCIVPSGGLLLSFDTRVEIGSGEGQKNFDIVHDYTGNPVEWQSSTVDLTDLGAETDRNNAVVSKLWLRESRSRGGSPHSSIRVNLTIHYQGATQ